MDDTGSLDGQLALFQALSSDLRIEILKQVIAHRGINLRQTAQQLGVSMSTLSPHIAKLEECGLIRILDVPASHGVHSSLLPSSAPLVWLPAGHARHSAEPAGA